MIKRKNHFLYVIYFGKKKRDKYRIFERICTINRTTCIGMKRCEREKGREREERREFNKWKTEKASEL